MRLYIKHSVNQGITLPISYQQILQGILYHLVESEDKVSTFLHDRGYQYEKRHYKLFTFSQIEGKYVIQDKRITFTDTMAFYVTSAEPRVLNLVAENLKQKGITYANVHIDEVAVYVSDETVEEEEIIIRMLSPVTVYETLEDGKTHFFEPEDLEFSQAVNDNFQRKYTSFYGVAPDSFVEIEPIRVIKRDGMTVRYKNFIIRGFKGIYRLRGKRKYLDFLFQTGLGAKNSQGFGMFEIIQEGY